MFIKKISLNIHLKNNKVIKLEMNNFLLSIIPLLCITIFSAFIYNSFNTESVSKKPVVNNTKEISLPKKDIVKAIPFEIISTDYDIKNEKLKVIDGKIHLDFFLAKGSSSTQEEFAGEIAASSFESGKVQIQKFKFRNGRHTSFVFDHAKSKDSKFVKVEVIVDEKVLLRKLFSLSDLKV
jgi:cell division protein YceG involved in septum cleavage